MAVQPAPHRFTVEEYYRMAEVGLLHPDARTELLEGEIIEMAAIGTRHAECVNRLTRLFSRRLADRAMVSVQNPIGLDRYSQPQPDVVLARLREEGYLEAHPGPDDVLLLVEVGDSTAGWDRSRKAPLYARAGFTEVWMIDLVACVLHRYEHPTANEGYREVVLFGASESIAPTFAPDVSFAIAEIVP